MSSQTNQEGNPSRGKRIFVGYTEDIGTLPERIFPLLCPVSEYAWIDTWSCTLLYTKSGVNEEGCIFREGMTGLFLIGLPLAATWITNRYDPQEHLVQFVIYIEDMTVIRYTITLNEQEGSKSSVEMEFEFTALAPDTAMMDEDVIRSRLLAVAMFLSKSLKHYCETGKMLKSF